VTLAEVKVFYCDHFVLPLPADHAFPMEKYRRVRDRITELGLVEPSGLLEAPRAEWDDIRRVHDAAYVDAVERGTLGRDMQRRIGFPWSPEMVERSRRSVGATLAASRAALAGPVSMAANLAGGTHHAFADRGEGFCVFNDVAVAARRLLHDGIVGRVLVADCDVHQGNGTAAIFARDRQVFTFSMHGANNFPFRKERSHLDVEWPDGTGDEEYLAALEAWLPALLVAHAPGIVFYLAGADPYEGDRWGRLKLTIDGLRQRDETVLRACAAARVPVAISMAGGYARDIDAIATIHANTIAVAAAIARSTTTAARTGTSTAARTGR
jgi:acetoin utilization deacetylase AcuC-like enzyme